MKKTAVEWLEDYIDKEINKYSRQPMDLNAIHALNHIKHYACNQAKEMEKEQIKDAFDMGFGRWNDGAESYLTAEQYYDQTFKSEEL
jgi:hypothetical protein